MNFGIHDFNSSMVRLKAFEKPSLRFGIGFQFQYGAIKSVLELGNIYCHIYFNSSMVRLKEDDELVRRSTLLFQFQYGAIKRSNHF